MIAVRRIRAHAALFGAILGVAALLAGLGTGLVGGFSSAALDGARSGIAQLAGAPSRLVFDAPEGADAAAQDARARSIIARELAGVPVTVALSRRDGDLLWTVTARSGRLVPADLATLAGSGTRILDALLADRVVGAQGVEKSGGLATQARLLNARITPLAAIEPVPLLLVAAIGVVTVAELARLLDGVRRRETALLRSRGASAARVGAGTAAELAVIAGVGAPAGAALATAVLLGLGAHPLGLAPLASIVLAVVAVTVALGAGIAYGTARTTFRRESADDSGRARRLAGPGLLVVLTAAAAVALWRFLQFGSPLSPTRTGSAVDPIAVLAPALVLADVAVLGVAAFPLVVGLVERRAERGARLGAVLVARQLARRVRLVASPLVLVALAVGGLVLAGSYGPTWRTVSTRTDQLHAGADLVVTGTDAAGIRRLAALKGVDAAAPVVTTSWTDSDDEEVPLTAVPAPQLARTVSDADGAVAPAALASALGGRAVGIALPDGGAALRVTGTWSGPTPTLTATVLDADGDVESVPLARSGHDFTAALPDGSGRALIALDVRMAASAAELSVGLPQPEMGFTVDGIAVGAHTLDLGSGWTARNVLAGGDPSAASVHGAGFVGSGSVDALDVRLSPAGRPVPLALSRQAAARLGVKVGQTVSVGLDAGGQLDGRVAAVLDELPGASGDVAALADLRAVQAQRVQSGGPALTATRAWVGTDAPAAVAARIRAALPAAQVTGPDVDAGRGVLRIAPAALWVGAAGSALLALIALAAVAGELLRLRGDEVGVLRALGLEPRSVARLRRAELVAVVAAALVVGAAGGALAAGLTVVDLARAAVTDAFAYVPVVLRADPVWLAAAGLAVAAATAVVIGLYGARVARQARTLVVREAAR
ncbi:FtsX-like permease family protein [Gryllotalpicola ginsengisoli]|uniref:FtsX-like permease family protein n=1 Tax=Gryllotalpicola ginsengisoli TaxID=444608 RepID=UPI0003B3E65D|nr:FtsX-like permease family protein [Gryllotalpicola ginsengisoli]